MGKGPLCFVTLLGCTLFLYPLHAQSDFGRFRTTLSAEDILQMPSFSASSAFAISANGEMVAYTIERVTPNRQKAENHSRFLHDTSWQKRKELWIADLHTYRSERICCEDESAFLPTWSPNGEFLAFSRSSATDVSSFDVG